MRVCFAHFCCLIIFNSGKKLLETKLKLKEVSEIPGKWEEVILDMFLFFLTLS